MIGTYLTQTATLRRQSTIGADGSRTFTETTIPCRIEYRVRKMVARNGEEVDSTIKVFTTSVVRLSDEIVVDGRSWPVLSVEEMRTLTTVSHYEVYL